MTLPEQALLHGLLKRDIRGCHDPGIHGGFSATDPWGVEGSTSDPRDAMATVRFDGVVHHVEHDAPHGFPGDNGTTAKRALFGKGLHTVEFVFYVEGTRSEIGRASVTVHEGTS